MITMQTNIISGVRVPAVAAAASSWALRSAPLAGSPVLLFVKSISVTLVTPVQTELGLFYRKANANQGTPNLTSLLFRTGPFSDNVGNYGNPPVIVRSWTVDPTWTTTTALARITLPATIGATATLTFGERGIAIRSNDDDTFISQLGFVNLGATACAELDVNMSAGQAD